MIRDYWSVRRLYGFDVRLDTPKKLVITRHLSG